MRTLALFSVHFSALLFIPSSAFALGTTRGSVSLEVGGVLANMIRTTNSNTANSSLLGTPQTLLGLSFNFWNLRPEVDYTVLGRSDQGNTYTSKLLILSVPYAFGSVGETQWKLGPSVWIQTLSGSGGNIDLANGTGTATFSKPGRSVSTRTLGILIGATFPLSGNTALDFDLQTLAPLTSRRAYNFMAQMAWSFL